MYTCIGVPVYIFWKVLPTQVVKSSRIFMQAIIHISTYLEAPMDCVIPESPEMKNKSRRRIGHTWPKHLSIVIPSIIGTLFI